MINTKHIVLFDGDCNFCNYWVKFILKRDKKDSFRFASLQSEVGKEMLAKNGLEFDLSTVVLLTENKVYTKSGAALKIGQLLGSVYGLSVLFWIIPKLIRDYFYDVIAKNRKQFLKEETCVIPTVDMKNKFLN